MWENHQKEGGTSCYCHHGNMADPCGGSVAEPPEKKKRLDLKTKKRDRLLFSRQVTGDPNKTETKSLNNPSCIKLSSSMLYVKTLEDNVSIVYCRKVMYGSVLSNEEVKSFPKSQVRKFHLIIHLITILIAVDTVI